MGAGLGHPTLVQHDDAIGATDGGEAVGDQQGGAPGHEPLEGLQDEVLGLGVEGGGGLVEDEHRGVAQQGPGDGDPLALPTRQRRPPLAQHRVVALGQGGDELVDVGRLGRGLDLRGRGAGASVGDVVGHRHGEQERLLQHDGHLGAHALQRGLPHVDAVDAHGARPGVEEARHQGDEGGLAGAGRTHDGHRLARAGLHVDVSEHCSPRVVAKGHALDADVAPHVGEGPGPGGVGHLGLGVKDLRHPASARPRFSQGRHYAREAVHLFLQ